MHLYTFVNDFVIKYDLTQNFLYNICIINERIKEKGYTLLAVMKKTIYRKTT